MNGKNYISFGFEMKKDSKADNFNLNTKPRLLLLTKNPAGYLKTF